MEDLTWREQPDLRAQLGADATLTIWQGERNRHGHQDCMCQGRSVLVLISCACKYRFLAAFLVPSGLFHFLPLHLAQPLCTTLLLPCQMQKKAGHCLFSQPAEANATTIVPKSRGISENVGSAIYKLFLFPKLIYDSLNVFAGLASR